MSSKVHEKEHCRKGSSTVEVKKKKKKIPLGKCWKIRMKKVDLRPDCAETEVLGTP